MTVDDARRSTAERGSPSGEAPDAADTGAAETTVDPDEALLEEFRDWLERNRPGDWRALDRHRLDARDRAVVARDWERTLGRAGWLGLTWPPAHGGRGASKRAAALVARELAEAGAPELFNIVGLDLVGPAIVAHGTEEQKRRFLPAILDGQVWCQGFSEPDAGSDLAGLKTRAVPDGRRHYVVSGQKTWSTYAGEADHCILLARTEPDAPKHRGITCFLVPMDLPGLEVRPISQITGDSEFCELFFDECEVPAEAMLGAPGEGWRIAMGVLQNERNSIFSLLGTVHRDLEGMVELVAGTAPGGPRSELESRAVELFVEESVVQWSNERATERFAAGEPDARLDSVMKLSWSELHQRISEVAVDALGAAGLVERGDPDAVDDGRWLFAYLQSRAETIYAGTSEIQRNIIAERVLGLPRA